MFQEYLSQKISGSRHHRPASSRSADSLAAQKYMTGRCEAGPTAREAGGVADKIQENTWCMPVRIQYYVVG